MSIKKKLPLIFTTIVLCIVITNSALHYFRSKEKLIEYNERETELIIQEISYQVENSKDGALYVEDILARELRTASIMIQHALPPDYHDVTNEQLVELANQLNVSHITLLAQTEDDIIGVRSSDPDEINMSTKDWLYWYDAFQQLFDLEPVTVEEGLALENYWSGPIEIAASNPDHTDKWGYYYDGTTNYMINPYFRDSQVLEYEKQFGPGNVIERFEQNLEGILELTVFNPENFGQESKIVLNNGNTFIRISDQPVWYGSYDFKNQAVDADMIQSVIKAGERQSYTEEVNGKIVTKTFVPIFPKKEDPYVIGLTYDYSIIQNELENEMIHHIFSAIPFILLALLISLVFSRSITKPIGHIVERVNDIARGNFGGSIELKRKDELGDLSNNVNALSQSLQNYVNDLEKSQEVIRFQAYHDPLTGLLNRRAFQEELQKRIDCAKETGETIAVLFIDIDRFKDVNDTLGHAKGDQLITLIAERIETCLSGGNSVVTRQGGDEFIILLNENSEENIMSVAHSIVTTISQPYLIGENEVNINASCGICLYPKHTDNPETLMIYADGAMYAAKKESGNKVVLYNEEITKEKNDRYQVEDRLRKAINHELIEVYYQPQIDARGDVLTGVEALLRWTDEELGFVPPEVFISVAEDIGMIHRLWEIAMEQACCQVRKWNEDRDVPLSLAVNFSAKQFQDPDALVRQVKDFLRKCQLDPVNFEVEITESALLYNVNEISKALKELQDYGISISIDDFGTGYSSLSYLKNLPINTLKIDRSFIQDIKENHDNTQIPEAVINLARSLQLRVIAEGVEEKYQKDFLVDNQCTHMQGYLFSKPLTKTQFEEHWLRK
ncbi:EAL domain-containing protein [Mesobacillus maritimus]|uniref:EAL domain-containing protein n=1 Tax=Mesobacillus maritimus TaxID=1643336 RepID=A0ABS7K7Y6_9BACI|nr:EAL domain-containing protein [Mesobacillus maritimus]MBY0098381.1 EAL domain-containing protein [Mesobacillus maritimus]